MAVLPTDQNVVLIDHVCSISEALQTLAVHGILSAPVYNRLTDQYLGSVDVMDLVAFVVDAQARSHSLPADLASSWRPFNQPVLDIVNMSNTNPFFPVPTESGVSEALNMFYSEGVHRLPLVDSQNNLVAVVSQSDVLHFLNQHQDRPELIKDMAKSVGQLDLAPGRVVSVSEQATMADCFAAIVGNHVSGVAIVDDQGRLVGTISASDLKGMTQETFMDLGLSVREFLRRANKWGRTVACTMNTPLGEAIDTLDRLSIHRLFVVDASNKPISVVSLTDIMRIAGDLLPIRY